MYWLEVKIIDKNADLSHIRRFAWKRYGYMDAYRLKDKEGTNLTTHQIESAIKK